MMNDRFYQIAEEFKQARLKSELTLKQIASRTRIEIKYLYAIEEGNFSYLPDVYINAFIKEFASEIGLSPKLMSEKFKAAKEGKKEDLSQFENVENELPTTINENKSYVDSGIQRDTYHENPKNDKTKIYLYGGLGLIILTIISIFIFNAFNKETIVIENAYSPSTEIEKPKVDSVKQDEKVVLVVNPFHLKMIGIDTVWVRAQVDNEKTEEFTLVPSLIKVYDIKSKADLIVGSATSLKIFIDGKHIQVHGIKGQVKNLSITKNGIQFN